MSHVAAGHWHAIAAHSTICANGAVLPPGDAQTRQVRRSVRCLAMHAKIWSAKEKLVPTIVGHAACRGPFSAAADPDTARDFDYRRGWIEDLLAYQARVFAIDVGNFNVLGNHAHTILRTRPDLAAGWSAEELALRWKLAWPEFLDGQWVREPTDEELDRLLAQPEKIEQIRRHLSSLSWFMARWKEPIARLCNAETDCRGHFWEARFGSRELLDDEAVLTCSIYVDLNQPARGWPRRWSSRGIRRSGSGYWPPKSGKRRPPGKSFGSGIPRASTTFSAAQSQALFGDCWLAPIAAEGPLLTAASLSAACVLTSPSGGVARPPIEEPAVPEMICQATVSSSTEAPTTGAAAESPASQTGNVTTTVGKAPVAPSERVPRPRPTLARRRASDAPMMAVAWSEYLRVVEAMASRVVAGGQTRVATNDGGAGGEVDAQLRGTLERWGMHPTAWLARLDQLDRQCARVLGAAHRVFARARGLAQQRFHGISLCREIFAASASDGFT